MERLLVDVAVDDLVAPVVVEIGQERRRARHRRMDVAVDGAAGDHAHSIAFRAVASTSGDTEKLRVTIACNSLPESGATSSLPFAASARNPGSFMVSSNAWRIAATRSGGVPGG